jgi:xylulose-5-phosphate/fructose-6-phosphate phosphoketolase
VIVADKQPHLVYLNMDEAILHCTKGIGIWDWASTDGGEEPDVVVASAGDILTEEALAAVAILRERFPDLKIRFVNVVDLYRLQPDSEHPHGLSDRDFDSLFTKDKPVIFNFHGYPWLIHKFTYRRTNHDNIHVRGYKEKGNINTPLELAPSTSSTACRACGTSAPTPRNGCAIRSPRASTTRTPGASTSPKSATGPGHSEGVRERARE